MSQHAQPKIEAGLRCLLFFDPRDPWQQGRNENTNGLLSNCLESQAR